MFDVLPTDVPFEELKPGDLIFYSGPLLLLASALPFFSLTHTFFPMHDC